MDKRGLRRSNRPTFADEPINLPKGEARINVNLDELDVDEAAEVVETGEMEHEDSESLEEISASAGRPSTARGAPRAAPAKTALRKPAVEGFAPFEEVDLAYFYADGIAPPEDAEPDPGLLELVENLPVAELVAESLDEYKASLEAEAEPEPAPAAQDRKLPVEAQPAPAEPVPAVTLSDEEFKKLINGLDVDPIGEWEHTYAEQGPLEVVAYDS
ncbi:MAG: hypothetical protein M5U26_27730 [Planctomycetota bacterium]|nr:hypothetical protein [Planctomycetota bacterium]